MFDSLLDLFAQQAHALATTGVRDHDGNQRWLMLLFITGDWPWLAKSGNFARHFGCVQKRRNQQAANGICHECRAGQPGVPWEQLGTRRPVWVATLFEQNPFNRQSPFAQIPHVPQQLCSLWTWGFFHTWFLGAGKVFLGGTLALLSMQENESNVEERFSALSRRYMDFCKANKLRAHIQKLTKEAINWATSKDFPSGAWHKGELTTVLFRFVHAQMHERTFDQEPLFEKIKQACDAIGMCISLMYRSDLWLGPIECANISGYGLRFLRRYEQLSHESGNLRGLNLFAYTPKFHILQKILLRLHWAGNAGQHYLNPLSVSCQQCEDFIGRPSRLSRRVAGSRLTCERVVDRYLEACYPQWLARGYLVRPV